MAWTLARQSSGKRKILSRYRSYHGSTGTAITMTGEPRRWANDVIDGEVVTIGSSNIGERSFVMNFEVNAFIYDRDFARKNEEIFLTDLESCFQVNAAWFASRKPIIRGAFGLSRLFAPLM